MAPAAPAHPSFGDSLRVWVRIALLSFGGPAGQIAVMHRILVDEKRWISEARFLHALNYCMLLPGPEAQQLATYIGWLLHGVRGGAVAGCLFILPGAVAIMALSILYATLGGVGFVEALFFGLKAAVLAIVLQAVVRVGRRAIRGPAMLALAAAAFLALFAFQVSFPLVILAAAVVGLIGGRLGLPGFGRAAHGGGGGGALLGDDAAGEVHPSRGRAFAAAGACLLLWVVPVAILLVALGDADVFSRIAILFSKMAVVTFGGAYAALAYVAQQAVEQYGWLAPGEMLDGLGMAETTPGPLIMVLQFVGFMAAFRDPGVMAPLLAGALGGLIASWVTFVPCFLWIFLGAPFVESLRGNRALSAALSAITAAVVGVILNLALWFAIHTLFRTVRPVEAGGLSIDLPVVASVDPWALLLAAAALVATFRFRVGMIPLLAGALACGVALDLAGLIG